MGVEKYTTFSLLKNFSALTRMVKRGKYGNFEKKLFTAKI